jgi:hypothetical protein
MATYTEQEHAFQANDYRRRAENHIAELVRTIIHGHSFPKASTTATRIHRHSVVIARAAAIDYGYDDNEIIASALRQNKVPHARTMIVGPPTLEQHPGLSNALGVFYKAANGGLDLSTNRGKLRLDALCRNVDSQTPDATDTDRRGLTLSALAKVGIEAELIPQLSQDGYPRIEARGNEYSLLLTPNSTAQEAQTWLTPYLLLDLNGHGAYSKTQ